MYSLAHQHDNGFQWRDAFRMAFLIALGIFIFRFFQLQQGDWLLYTIAFIYMGGVINGLALQRAVKRLFAAPAGFYMGFLFLGLFSYYDYHYTYLLPLFVIFAFWYLFTTGEYGGFVVFFITFFMLFYDLNSNEYQDFNVLNLVICRTFATLLGCLLVIVGELVIFPQTNNVFADSKRLVMDIFFRLADVSTTIGAHCHDSINMQHDYWLKLAGLNEQIEKLRETVTAYRQEPDAKPQIVAALNELRVALLMVYDGVRIMELSCNSTAFRPDETLMAATDKLVEQLKAMNIQSSLTLTSCSNQSVPYAIGLHKATDGVLRARTALSDLLTV